MPSTSDGRVSGPASAAVFERGLEQARDAEVGQAGAAIVADQHVLGLDVAVHDAAAVRVRERLAHLAGDVDRLRHRQRQPPRERAARHELHHQVRVAGGGGAEVVHGDDARMLQARERARLAREAGAEMESGSAALSGAAP